MVAAKHKRTTGRWWKVLLVCVGVLALLGGGTAYAAYRYDRSAADEILPGVSVAGVEVGGMTREQAVHAVEAEADTRLQSSMTVEAAGTTWTVTPASLGMTADVEGAVDQAFALADRLSFFSRVYHRLAEKPVAHDFELAYAEDPAAVDAFVQQAFAAVAKPAVDAEFALVDGQLVTRRSVDGRELKSEIAAKRILRALDQQVQSVEMPVREIVPEITTASLGNSIVVDISDNTLQFYDGMHVVKRFNVATGTPQYPTPVGTFEIVNKVENPTWYNPAPDTWGAGLPASIGPGPGNPLGTRAMYLNAPGIRIHGTWDDSSIGTAASHGCIRMHVQDSEALYPLVPIGTRVIVKP
jgi:lipoprotein-anchoring transpeptidase ErfK/SrfK